MPDAASLLDPPVLLTEAHDPSVLRSGEPVLDDWLRQRAWSNLQSAASRTYVVCPDFYRHHGFTRLPVDTPTLAIDLLKFQKLNAKA